MDSRFPKWLRVTLDKLDFIGIPNLAPLVCGMAVLAFFAQMSGSFPIERFMFNPERVLDGEWWRLFPFPIPQSLDFWFIFEVMILYYIINGLEAQWGAGPITVFMLLGYLCTVGASFISLSSVNIWRHILINLGFAYGTLFPDFEIMIMFVLPVKVKWIALLFGVIFGFQFIVGSVETKLFLFLTLLPYLLFFSPMLYDMAKNRRKLMQHKKRFDKDMWR